MKMIIEHRWNDTDRGIPKYSLKNLSQVPFCPSQVSCGLARDSTRTSAVRGLATNLLKQRGRWPVKRHTEMAKRAGNLPSLCLLLRCTLLA
jgi:hypothetical protein